MTIEAEPSTATATSTQVPLADDPNAATATNKQLPLADDPNAATGVAAGREDESDSPRQPHQ